MIKLDVLITKTSGLQAEVVRQVLWYTPGIRWPTILIVSEKY
jgi:hypothetical protein